MASSERTDQTATPVASADAQSTAASTASAGASASTDSPSVANAQTGAAGSGQRGQGEERFSGSTGGVSGPAPSQEEIEGCTVSCLTNAQYHASREAFLDTIHRWVMFFVIALSGAALTDILPKMTGIDSKLTTDVLVATGAILAALDLTFDLSNRARIHSMMKRRYFELLADLRDHHKSPEHVKVCIERFSADEEPQFRVLFLACWNTAQETVYGNKRQRYKIGYFSNLFKNWWRRPSADIQWVDSQA
jgi:hypothetical protein